MNGFLPCILFPCLTVVAYLSWCIRWSLADYHRPVPYLFCLPFPNRASDSGDLYIDFNRNHLTFPLELLDFQVEARFANEEPVEFAYEDQVNSDNFPGKMIIPSKSLLSLLARCSLFCSAYATILTTCLSCLQNCHVKPLTHHVLAGEDWRSFLVGTLFICWDIIILSCYLNASIYLVKGGRLSLLPSVLFHSCRPSFRHIGVMFSDFAFLTRLGYNGNPLTVRFE